EPLAGEMLARLVRYGLATVPPTARPMRLLAGTNEVLRATLAACSVVTTPGLDGDGPILVDGSQTLTDADLAKLKAQLAAGGVVWLHGFAPEALAKLAGLFPAAPRLVPFDKCTQGAAVRQTHAWAGGLSSFDLYWTRVDLGFRGDPWRNGQVTAKLGDYTIELPSLEAGRPLTSPNFLSRLPVGPGAVLLDTLAWEGAYGAETAKVSRLVDTLTSTLGGDVRLAAEREYSYFPVDLAPYANMGYYDQTAGDGKGGWTDQGQNDMRFFLTNHLGRAGGIEGAAEVNREPWPAEVRLAGRPFKLADPTKPPGKGVIALRGGQHAPTLPSEVKGIRVGGLAERLWFLHTACWAVAEGNNAVIGRYVIHYEDGTSTVMPLRYGLELKDWWDPAPLSGSQVAWTGRNLMHSPIGLWVTPWENPNPDKAIATIDFIGDLTQTQLVLLGITGGVSQGGAKERLAAQWRLADAADGKVANRVDGGPPLSFGQKPPTAYTSAGHAGLHFDGGQSVGAESKPIPALTSGGPFSLEMSLAAEKPPAGYMGGLFECMKYRNAGFRLVYYQNMKLGVEIFTGPEKAAFLTGPTVLQPGRFYRVKVVFDGQRAQLLLDGKLEASVDTPPPAGCDSGLRVGQAAGDRYDLVGVVEEISLRTPGG
ncbi:MAG: hypothetical protein HZB16_07235, partial [Armatimonadetes bacterium]|nr:hypothetical protein [Armatimonadota bacterium]